MFQRRRARLATALFAVLSLLLSQLALANYVCPMQHDGAAMAEMMASGMPCQGTDMDQPVLCAQHASSAAQSFEVVKLPTLAAPMVVQVLTVALELDAGAACAVPLSATPEARPPPDPLFLSTLRLRV